MTDFLSDRRTTLLLAAAGGLIAGMGPLSAYTVIGLVFVYFAGIASERASSGGEE